MIGPSLEEKGGMGSVGTLILNTVPADVQMQHISTWDGERSRDSGIHRSKVFLEALLLFWRKLLADEVDLVHIHLAERGSALRKAIIVLMAIAFRKPVILHAHGCEFHSFHGQLSPVIKRVLNLILRQSTHLIALSESWRDYYIDYCGFTTKQVVVFPNPVEIPENIPDRVNSNQKIKFVSLGRIGKRKGTFDLLNAFAKLTPKQQEKSELVLAGIGELEEAGRLAKMLNVEQHVTFAGWVDPQQRGDLLADADVFVLPSYNEGLPMALLEAMSWGLPSITTPVGGIPEVITHQENGWLVNPGNIKELSNALGSFIEDASLRQVIGKAARQQIIPLDIKIYKGSLYKLYCSSLGIKPTPVIELASKSAVAASYCKESVDI